MSADVRRIVRERSQCECVLVDVGRLRDQRLNEVSAADVMDQIAEEPVPERVVTHVLDQRPTIGVGVGGP